MMGNAEIAGIMREELFKLLREEGVDALPGDDDSLVSSGLLDSLMVVTLATAMERRFGLDFSLIPFDANIFETVTSMAAFVEANQEDA